MSWVAEDSLTYLQKFCINVLKCGPIPRHVAFIMDGNRRYAKKVNVQKVEGHSRGFNKLSECLQWCRQFGINEVTVYAFSIENFNRSQEEVDGLMNLAREKFKRIFEEQDKLMNEGVCIRVIGNISLLPDDLKKLIADAMLMTRHNKQAFLNVAFSYTSREEITNAVRTVIEGVEEHSIELEDIDEELLDECMYTNLSPNPDLLVRTSGEIRLSDFLLWQSTTTPICFTNVLWPEFSVWHLMAAVFKYQRAQATPNVKKECRNERVANFINNLNDKRFKQLEIYSKA